MKQRAAAMTAIALAAVVPVTATADGHTEAAKPRVVYGLVNEKFEITLEDGNGKRIVRLAPGSVTFRIHDASKMHNFHLRGPGFDRATIIETTGRVVWKVSLKTGKWRFRCDEHPLVMHGSFVVAAPTANAG